MKWELVGAFHPTKLSVLVLTPGATQGIFNEALDVFREGMMERVLDYSGEHFQFEQVSIPIGPLQKPHPPYGTRRSAKSGTTYAAKNGFNFLTLGPPELVSQLACLYRQTWAEFSQAQQTFHDLDCPKIGAMRQIFIGETDQQALGTAEAAYQDWYQSITELWRKNGDTSFDDFFSWEACLASETILIGSPETVRDKIEKLVEQSGINYFVGSFAWGSLTFEESKESFERFVSQVMPALEMPVAV